jgi:hypothetical protein
MTYNVDRRRGQRGAPDHSGWSGEAVLRPGLRVRILNIGPFGALVECQARLRPGRRAELQLLPAGSEQKQVVSGRVERCEVITLQPLSFHGAIAFETAVRFAGRVVATHPADRLGRAGSNYP